MERFQSSDFIASMLNRRGMWAVCFAADWCGFCRDFVPKFARLDGKEPFRVAVADLSDQGSRLWELFGIDIVPTVIVFIDGNPAWRRDGVPGAGLDTPDLQAMCNLIGGKPCTDPSVASQPRWGSFRPRAQPASSLPAPHG